MLVIITDHISYSYGGQCIDIIDFRNMPCMSWAFDARVLKFGTENRDCKFRQLACGDSCLRCTCLKQYQA